MDEEIEILTIGTGLTIMAIIFIAVYPAPVEDSNARNSLIQEKCESIGLTQIEGRTECEGLNKNGEYITKKLVLYKGKYEVKEGD